MAIAGAEESPGESIPATLIKFFDDEFIIKSLFIVVALSPEKEVIILE